MCSPIFTLIWFRGLAIRSIDHCYALLGQLEEKVINLQMVDVAVIL